ncbi:GvpL/GvpF family gas vesicle protein [Alteribacillus iranensis]|uniref:Gas vesicle synthesis protein GvpL/GvpF n=1 Tax=Alteribacillus iranensis TaxID=930128 RepID=A0A1I2EJD7_9BACI|nr:GvpL/GvpF family gas vesicle protein [Alteribacillus iranensis]SFE92531.1 Gas vesicle synthesis protein GvpL/GvpF [Alteribacillus iranensis]
MQKEEGLYLFAVIPKAEERSFGTTELDGRVTEVFTVPFHDMSMVTASAPIKIYEPTRKNARNHQQTISRVMEEFSVIPMSFGNILEDREDVHLFMEQLYEQFQHIFPKIENKIEVGLKLMGKKEWITEQANKNPSLQRLKRNAASAKPHYYEQLKLGEAAKSFVTSLHSQFEQEVFQPLAELSEAAKSNEVINERMLLNASFLISLENEEAFDARVNEIYEKWKSCIDFTYTGPWPAYNFINLKIKAGQTS